VDSEFEIIRAIGQGAYGEVFLARARDGSFRAVKVIFRESFDHNRPFEREYEGLRKFQGVSRSYGGHVEVFHVGRQENPSRIYYIMELADDQDGNQCIESETYIPKTLASELKRRGRLPIPECLRIGASLVRALENLHDHGLIHRDVKPANIIFVKGVTKLADIGLVTDAAATVSHVGTEGFIPPEGPGSPQADIYSLGKVLYEMSTGLNRLDFPELPLDLHEWANQQGMLELNAIVAKACEPDPRQRYHNVREMLSDILCLQGGNSVRRRRTLQRRITLAAKAAVGIILCGLIMAGIRHFQSRTAISRQQIPTISQTVAVPSQTLYTPYAFVTLAGAPGVAGSNDGIGVSARFNAPHGIAVDSGGNVYVADMTNHVIRRIAPNGKVTTLAGSAGQRGSADGTGSAARFETPWGVAVDNTGNVYVADAGNNTIRRIDPGGKVSTLAGLAGAAGSSDGLGSAARFDYPQALVADTRGTVYVTDSLNHTIRRISPSGMVTTVAGLARHPGNADGRGSAARFRCPAGITMDSAGNLFVADEFNHTIRKITPDADVITFAGLAKVSGSTDGIAMAARFHNPHGCAVDDAHNLYVSDMNNGTIRRITPDARVTTLAGLPGGVGSTDGTGTAASFSAPRHTTVDSAGNIYVADFGNHTIRKGWVATGPSAVR